MSDLQRKGKELNVEKTKVMFFETTQACNARKRPRKDQG